MTTRQLMAEIVDRRNDKDELDDDLGMSVAEMWSALRAKWARLILVPVAAALIAFGVTSWMAPTYTAVTTFLPPQQSQGSGLSNALGSIAGLASLSGIGSSLSSPADRYVVLMQSMTVSDRVIDAFKLIELYESKFRTDARTTLAQNVRFAIGKKDGLITIEVDDHSPQRAADIANRYIQELRTVTSTLVVTEAQQRRLFFEQQLKQSRDHLVLAQQALQTSGFNSGALKSEPKAAAEGYAKLKAETTAAEVRLQTMRGLRADGAPEVLKQQGELAALRNQLALAERAGSNSDGPDYVSKYREFKYQETLFELYARQYELARLDESREGALIQVVDKATPPERKSKPKRALISAGAALVSELALLAWVIIAYSSRRPAQSSSASST